jgi:hypothetical protein
MNITGHLFITTNKTMTYRYFPIVRALWCALFFVSILNGHAEMPDITLSVDSLAYRSDFRCTQVELDSLILFSPQFLHLEETIRTRNQDSIWWRKISLHFSYNPMSEPGIKTLPGLGFGTTISLGTFLSDTHSLDKSEKSQLITTLRLQTRTLMSQRQQLLASLDHTIQQYQTTLHKLRKAQVSLSLSEASTDDILDIKDRLAGLLANNTKTKLAIRLLEDQLLALIGVL